MLVFLEIEIAESFFRAASDTLGAGELRHEQAAAAQAANDASEKRVRHAGHGSKDRCGADGQVANLEARWNHRFSLGACARCSKMVSDPCSAARVYRVS